MGILGGRGAGLAGREQERGGRWRAPAHIGESSREGEIGRGAKGRGRALRGQTRRHRRWRRSEREGRRSERKRTESATAVWEISPFRGRDKVWCPASHVLVRGIDGQTDAGSLFAGSWWV
jgi:hypothetical protein